MRRILFVDDEPRILDGLRRMLHSKRGEWWTEFESSGEAALDAIKAEPFDIVVSDMKMPGMNGAELLSEVRRIHPESIRIILSGHSSNGLILQAVGPTHRYLTKPCNPETLKQTIDRVYALQDLLRNPTLRTRASEIEVLPSLPFLFERLTSELKRQASLERICEIIRKDIAMTAKVLQLVNSAYFGVMKPISSVKQAVTHLGPETINSLMRSSGIFAPYRGNELPGFSVEALWRHSRRTALFAETIGALEGVDEKVAEQAFAAGMLHDVGKLILAARVPELYVQVLERTGDKGDSVSEAETQVLGATHGEVGAYLLGLWGLPDPIVEAVAYHARPWDRPDPDLETLTIVHAASRLAREQDAEDTAAPAEFVDENLGDASKIEARLPWWREACREAARGVER